MLNTNLVYLTWFLVIYMILIHYWAHYMHVLHIHLTIYFINNQKIIALCHALCKYCLFRARATKVAMASGSTLSRVQYIQNLPWHEFYFRRIFEISFWHFFEDATLVSYGMHALDGYAKLLTWPTLPIYVRTAIVQVLGDFESQLALRNPTVYVIKAMVSIGWPISGPVLLRLLCFCLVAIYHVYF